MAFRYSFQKIVDLKSSEKTQAEWTLSTAVGRLKMEEEDLQGLRRERQALQNQILNAVGQQVTVSEMLIYQNYLSHIDSRISRKREEVQAAKQHVDQKQEVLSAKVLEEKNLGESTGKSTAAVLGGDE
ncbi:flagellar export protein FliJ [Paenibacillus senegalensis]|uniref:flagellar export protein FliJ n=1 Tax=Paenibacillus senegalensis TaxID=1465766 RepID=UPI000288B4FA|nr:flagellar export protein FliJ [Paenibacillus senegalensis]